MRDVAAEDLVTIRLLAPVTNRIGGGWNRGEEVGFPPDVALDLIERGAAEAVAEPQVPTEKAPIAPPRDKMLREAPSRKS